MRNGFFFASIYVFNIILRKGKTLANKDSFVIPLKKIPWYSLLMHFNLDTTQSESDL